MAYRNPPPIQPNNRPTGGQGALRRMSMGNTQGRNQMSRYSGPDARPAGESRQRSGADNIRAMLTQGPNRQQPNAQAFQNANPNASFMRQPPSQGDRGA